MTLPATTYATALGMQRCDYCTEGSAPADGPAVCRTCADRLYDEGRVEEFRDPSDGSFRVLVDGRDVL